MDDLLSEVFEHARCFQDTLRAKCTLMFSYGARQQMKNAGEIALEALDQLGESISRRPSKFSVLFALLKARWALRGKPDRFFVRLPPVNDQIKVETQKMLVFAFQFGYTVAPEVSALAALRSIRLTTQWGTCAASIPAIGGYATVLLGAFQMMEEAYRIPFNRLNCQNSMKPDRGYRVLTSEPLAIYITGTTLFASV